MKKYIFSFLFCIISLFFLAQAKSNNVQTVSGVKYYIHKIQKGQSLYSISKLYNVNLDDIYSINPETRIGTKVNQEIKIPFKSETVISNTIAVVSNSVIATRRAADLS